MRAALAQRPGLPGTVDADDAGEASDPSGSHPGEPIREDRGFSYPLERKVLSGV